MTISRRTVLRTGGALLAVLLPHPMPLAGEPVEIRMQGKTDGSDIWFDPIGLRIRPGQTLRWINKDPGNSHTSTAYHPSNLGRVLRIPKGAAPWDSGYLLPDESFSVTLTVEGVYDFFCIPHEHAGMVGRIIVGQPSEAPLEDVDEESEPSLPEAALRALPSVRKIMERGVIRRL